MGLTWWIWANALQGIQRFTVRYPGLEFDFWVSVEEGGGDGVVVATGELVQYAEGGEVGRCLDGVGLDEESRKCLLRLGGAKGQV